MVINLADFRRHVKEKSPAFVPLFKDQSRYQIIWGGAGCVHPETKIHTEYGLMRICDIDRPMRVLSWNEKSQKFQLSLSGGSFPKGKANLYQVTTQHGVFRSSGHHLVLLSTGEYRRVDMLTTSDEISQALPCPSQTIEEHCLKLSREDDPRLNQTILDSMGRYASECRSYDPQPHETGDYALFLEQQQDDVQEHGRFCSPCRNETRDISHSRSHPCLCDDRICRKHSCEKAQQIEPCEEGQTLTSFSECTLDSLQEFLLSQSKIEPHHRGEQSYRSEPLPLGFSGDSCKPPKVNDSAILSSASLIKSIEVVDESEYWCMQVLDTNNYVSEDGAIHHNSGKSHIVARKILYRLLKEKDCKHNFLIIRKVDRTIKRSVFTLIRNIISKWNLTEDFDINLTDKTMVYKPNGSQIMFSGLDDVEKLKSIEGVTSIWVEESTELTQEDFEQLDLRLRGDTGSLKQIILTLNPISEQHWIKKIFFDDPIDGTFTLKTTYLDNAFIDDEYKMVMENKKKTNPRYYNIYALGNWGTAEGLVFNRVSTRVIKESEIKGLECLQGLDFGYTNDPTAFSQSYVDEDKKIIYVYDGFYQKGMSNAEIAEKIKSMLAHKHRTTADSSEPKSIDYIRKKDVNIAGAMKGKDSVNAGIDYLLEYEIVVNSHLVEFMTEFNNYTWSVDKDGKTTNKPVDDFNHFIDSLRYAFEQKMKGAALVFAC